MKRRVQKLMTFPRSWVATLVGCGHVAVIDRAEGALPPADVECGRCDTETPEQRARAFKNRPRSTRGLLTQAATQLLKEVPKPKPGPKMLTLPTKAAPGRVAVGARVRVRGTQEVRTVTKVFAEIAGGVQLDAPSKGYRNWHVDDLEVIR